MEKPQPLDPPLLVTDKILCVVSVKDATFKVQGSLRLNVTDIS